MMKKTGNRNMSILFLLYQGIVLVVGLSISKPSEEIFSNQLCPDPTIQKEKDGSPSSSSGGSDWSWWMPSKSPHYPSNRSPPPGPQQSRYSSMRIMPINLDKPYDSTHFYESCTFREQGPLKGGVKQSVRVRSINLNVNPWNFSTSQGNCSNFIKFNNWDDHDGGRYTVLCGRENFDNFLGPLGHPIVLYYQWKNGGLSFPLFHSNYGEHKAERKGTLELKYLQMYFSVGTDSKDRKCRVQQYRLDWLRLGCSSSELFPEGDDEPICGEYQCSELDSLYRATMTTSFTDGDGENDTVLVWKSKNDKYKMRTFLRQKFVPIVFLVVLICAYRSYMKAGLRYQNSIQLDSDYPELQPHSHLHLHRPFRLRRPHSHTPRGRRSREPHWEEEEDDFDYDYYDTTTDEDPPPSYRIPENAVRVYPPPDTVVSITPPAPPPTTTQSMEPFKLLGEEEEDPPPSYDSICPPDYKEATKQ